MFCCWHDFIIPTLCLSPFIAIVLLLYFTGNIDLLPEVTKLFLHSLYCYVDAFFHFVVPRKQKNIEGQTALITGAGHGIGKEITLALVKKGVKVVLWDIDEENMDKVVKEVNNLGGQAYRYVCDVTDKEKVYKTAEEVSKDVGNIDILVNNAGTVIGKEFIVSSDSDIEKTMNLNLMSHFWTLRAFYPGMVERNSGHIVAISSILSLFSCPKVVDYCTSKAGVSMIMESLRQEALHANKHGICFTTILPTKVNTGLFEGAKGRFANIPPTVSAEYVAKKTIDAIERKQIYVILPSWLAMIFALKPFFPQKLHDELHKFTKLNEGMKDFVGHQKKV